MILKKNNSLKFIIFLLIQKFKQLAIRIQHSTILILFFTFIRVFVTTRQRSSGPASFELTTWISQVFHFTTEHKASRLCTNTHA